MNLPPERLNGSIRFSLSRYTTDADINGALDIIPGVINRLRESMAPLATNA
jgi:cysteine desulfurase